MTGHYYGQCPLIDRRRTVTQSPQWDYYFDHTITVHKYPINQDWILIDSCYTFSYVMNPSILSDIKDFDPDTAIRVFTNSRHLD